MAFTGNLFQFLLIVVEVGGAFCDQGLDLFDLRFLLFYLLLGFLGLFLADLDFEFL